MDSTHRTLPLILTASCVLAWVGNALYALGAPGGALKEYSPAIVVVGFVLFFCSHCSARYGRRLTLSFVVSVFLVAWVFETLSVLTGVPFGRYHYTDIMAPFVGHVPVFVLPAYLFMGYASWSLATLFLGARGFSLSKTQLITVPLLAAVLMLVWDLSMDPLRATIEGRWIWTDGGGFLGVPLSNFIGWLLVTWCMFALFAYFLQNAPTKTITKPASPKLYWVSIPIMYTCYAAEYLLNPFTGHGQHQSVVGKTTLEAQEIFTFVASLTALTFGSVLLAGLWVALQHATSGPADTSRLRAKQSIHSIFQ